MKRMFAGLSFQFWEYRVSHGQLLVRSPKHAAAPRNVDLIFSGVEYVDLPRHLPQLELDDPRDDDVLRAGERLGKPVEDRCVFVLKCQGRRHIVVAAAVATVESDTEIFDSPFDDKAR